MKFSNTNAVAELNFSVCGKAYKVEPGGEVDVDPAHVPYVIRRGLQLEASSFKPKKVEAPKAPAQKPAAQAKPAVVDPKAVAAALVAAVTKPVETSKSESK